MSDTMADFEGRVRERAYLLWEREGRPEGRADEHWRRAAAELEAADAACERDGRQRTDAEEPDGPADSAAAPRTGKTARKRRGPVGGPERAEASPIPKQDPSGRSSRPRTEPADGSVPSRDVPRRRRPSAAPRRGFQRQGAAGAAAGIAQESDGKDARPPPG
jgi:hypothetical protein